MTVQKTAPSTEATTAATMAGDLSESHNHEGTLAPIDVSNQPAVIPDPQVNTRLSKQRRRYSNQYKLKILEALDVCADPSERGALLRREGLYYSRISAWRKQREAGKFSTVKPKETSSQANNNRLARENAQLKKKLAQATAVIELQKKVSELLGQHILPLENSEIS